MLVSYVQNPWCPFSEQAIFAGRPRFGIIAMCARITNKGKFGMQIFERLCALMGSTDDDTRFKKLSDELNEEPIRKDRGPAFHTISKRHISESTAKSIRPGGE